MKASRRRVRCGVVEAYCCQTWPAISAAEELVLSVAGPEESFGVVGAGAGVGVEGAAEVVEAAWRLGAMIWDSGGRRCLGVWNWWWMVYREHRWRIWWRIGAKTVSWGTMAERRVVDASLELVITTVTWWSRSRFGSIGLSDNEDSTCLTVQWQIY